MNYRLPNLSLSQYRLLPADEQYLLISSIHALYERMLGVAPPAEALPRASAPMPAPAEVIPLPVALEAAQGTPDTVKRLARKISPGSTRSLILDVFMNAGEIAALTPQEIHQRVSSRTPTEYNAIRTALHRLVSQGLIERADYARYRTVRN